MEITAVEKAVKTLTENTSLVNELTNKALKGIGTLLDKGSYQRPMKVKNGDMDMIEQATYDLSSGDYKNCIEAIDKASITLNVNERFNPSSSIQVNNQNQQANHKIEIVLE